MIFHPAPGTTPNGLMISRMSAPQNMLYSARKFHRPGDACEAIQVSSWRIGFAGGDFDGP